MTTNTLQQIIDNATAQEQIIGATVLVAKKGQLIFKQHAGWADKQAQKPVTDQTVFRLASLTKPIVSATTLALVEQGVLALDVPITRWLPYFKPTLSDGTVVDITLRQLLNHTAGLSYGFLTPDNEPYRSAGVSDGMDNVSLSLEANLQRLSEVPLCFEPGSAWRYSLSTDVIGAIIEAACQAPLKDVVARTITQPLGMASMTFHVEDAKHLVRAYRDDELGSSARLMQEPDQLWLPDMGLVNFSPERITNAHAYLSAATGLAGTAHDYLLFAEALRTGTILSSESRVLLTEDSIPDFDQVGPGFGFSLGFSVLRDKQAANTLQSVGSYGWSGVYGVNMFIDPVQDLSVIIMTNTAIVVAKQFFNDVTQAVYAL